MRIASITTPDFYQLSAEGEVMSNKTYLVLIFFQGDGVSARLE